jgi:hypothetical protein
VCAQLPGALMEKNGYVVKVVPVAGVLRGRVKRVGRALFRAEIYVN